MMMAILHPAAHVSMEPYSSMISSPCLSLSTFSLKLKQRQRRTFRVGCALLQQERRESRRVVSLALVFLHAVSLPKGMEPFDYNC